MEVVCSLVDFSVKKKFFSICLILSEKGLSDILKCLYCNISLKNLPLFDKSPFLGLIIVQTELRLGNVQLDKMYCIA